MDHDMAEFGKVLIEAAEESLAIARKKKRPRREVLVSIPDRVAVAPIRKRLDMTQAEFAAELEDGAEVGTRQALSEAANAYLTVIDRAPQAVRKALQSTGSPRKKTAKPRHRAVPDRSRRVA